MIVSDLVNQYHNNLAAGSEVSTGTKGVEQLVETAKRLKSGNIFEGTVNSIKGNQVILGLSSGQNITARLDKGITLQKGQSVFFQVKSNDGMQIQIRPMSMGNTNNPTLLSALEAASLPVSEKNLNMVNAMMKEQMSIDSKSLSNMMRTVISHPNADVSTLVEMTKLNLPVTDELITQYESYKDHQGMLSQKFEAILNEIPQALASSDMSLPETLDLNDKILNFFLEGTVAEDSQMMTHPENQAPSEAAAQLYAGETVPQPGQSTAGETVTQPGQSVAGEAVSQPGPNSAAEITITTDASPEAAGDSPAQENAGLTAQTRQTAGEYLFRDPAAQQFLPREDYPAGTLGNVLPKESLQDFNSILQEFPKLLREHPQVFTADGLIRPEAEVKELLQALSDYAKSDGGFVKEDALSIFGHKSYKALLGHVMEQSWMMKPEQLLKKEGVREFYEKLSEQTQAFQRMISQHVKEDAPLARSASQLQDNLNFMNEVNQTYAYVQLPVKLSQQNVNGELYVYSNRKQEKNSEDGLSAFLHFDMDHIGSMDISVMLQGKNVDAKWYLESPETLELLSNNIHLLEQRLAAKGYQCNVNFESQERTVNFVEDFLKKDVSTGGEVHRYSFDVRA